MNKPELKLTGEEAIKRLNEIGEWFDNTYVLEKPKGSKSGKPEPEEKTDEELASEYRKRHSGFDEQLYECWGGTHGMIKTLEMVEKAFIAGRKSK